LHLPLPAAAAASGGVKVFVLAGQSNMEGKGKGSDYNPPPGKPPQAYHQGLSPGALLNGTLLYQVHDPRTAKSFAQYWDKDTGNWTVLDDVKVWFNEWGDMPCDMPGDCDGSPSPWRNCPNHDNAHCEYGFDGSFELNQSGGGSCVSRPGHLCKGNLAINGSYGNLTVGYGTNGLTPIGIAGNQNWNKTTHPWNDLFGPELGFGFGMHAALPGEKILIVKTAWGGKNLSLDFRPPRSAAAGAAGKDPHCPKAKRGCGQVGRFYRTMLADVAAVLSPGVVGAMFPEWADEEVSVAGFGWHQGWNDGCDKNMTAAYGK
jgi:hypothetical protein